jgi:hypothetical protein
VRHPLNRWLTVRRSTSRIPLSSPQGALWKEGHDLKARADINEGFWGNHLDNTFHVPGAYVMGATGPVSWKGEISYLTGESGLAGQPKTDVSGWIVYGGGFLNPEYQLAFVGLADTCMKELFLGPSTDRKRP